MRLSKTTVLSLSLGCLVTSMLMIVPAKSDGPATLRVPVELKKMVAEWFNLRCLISGPGATEIGAGYGPLGSAEKTLPIAGGEFNQVVEVVVQPHPGKNFVNADHYSCSLSVKKGENENLLKYAPEQGPPGPDLFRIAKPGVFFRKQVDGPIETGVVGPKNLKLK